MARITHVKKAQQRYRTVPVLDETGAPVRTAVQRRTGEQKVTKHGRAVTRAQVVEDRDQPLPPYTCESCRKPIEVGTPYKWVKPGKGSRRNRHESCPTWQPWDLSDALWARIARLQSEAEEALSSEQDSADSPDAFTDALAGIAEQIRELAEEKRESAQNIEDGFQHATYQSDELNETADNLDAWADEVEQVDIPEVPEPEEDDCDACSGTGKGEQDVHTGDYPDCDDCGGSGQVTPDDPSDDQMDEWRQEAVDAAMDVVNESPV